MDKHWKLTHNCQLFFWKFKKRMLTFTWFEIWPYILSQVSTSHIGMLFRKNNVKRCSSTRMLEAFNHTSSEKGPFRWPAGVIPPVGSNSCDCCSCICVMFDLHHLCPTCRCRITKSYAWLTIGSTPTFPAPLRAPEGPMKRNQLHYIGFLWVDIYKYIYIYIYI